jgi:hypothetical protein
MLFIILSQAGFLALLAVAFVDFLADSTSRRFRPGGAPTYRSASQSPDAAPAHFREVA